MNSGKLLPKPTRDTERFWEGCRNRELLIQQCSNCHSYQFYPRMICANCMSSDVNWVKSSGVGVVSTFTIVRRAPSKAYEADLPYVLALIKLDEGPTMMSNIIQCDPESVKTGMKVEVVFEDCNDEITLPKFRPVKNG